MSKSNLCNKKVNKLSQKIPNLRKENYFKTEVVVDSFDLLTVEKREPAARFKSEPMF